jgi:RNA polymerase-binding transcription factor DksA
MRDEILRAQSARPPGAKPDAAHREHETRQQAAERRLAQIESGLYPVCEDCGERIEVERLRQDALTARCARCAAHAEGLHA